MYLKVRWHKGVPLGTQPVLDLSWVAGRFKKAWAVQIIVFMLEMNCAKPGSLKSPFKAWSKIAFADWHKGVPLIISNNIIDSCAVLKSVTARISISIHHGNLNRHVPDQHPRLVLEIFFAKPLSPELPWPMEMPGLGRSRQSRDFFLKKRQSVYL